MPPNEYKTLAYAAGASLTAATLVYVVFGPTWLVDSNSSTSKKGVVGLANPANDCFINSTLQALAGLEELRGYLIRRTRLAQMHGELRRPWLTAALKDVLDSLNERPLHRKTISNRPFLRELEQVFRRPISRAQQDAHEFLQVVVEKLTEEHAQLEKRIAGKGRKAEDTREDPTAAAADSLQQRMDGSVVLISHDVGNPPREGPAESMVEEYLQSENMPLEGKLQSEIECLTCKFSPKPKVSKFVVLTLNVPQKSSTSLSECIDATLSTEHIDDYQCSRCKLQYALSYYIHRLSRATSAKDTTEAQAAISRLETALEQDPEHYPLEIPIPSSRPPPKSRIAKRTLMREFPDIIAFHLSRSIFDAYSSHKNNARVSFQEDLQMGSLLDRKRYRLLCVVMHKGGHDSGHYECFRRQIVARPPYSTPTPSVPSSPLLLPKSPASETVRHSTDSEGKRLTPPASVMVGGEDARRLRVPLKQKKKRKTDRWWRISDEKIKEARTSEILEMQKEVYLLFYQRVRDEESAEAKL